MSSGAAPFSVEDDNSGQRRQAYADDLTSAQLDFIFLAKQERELMKRENAEREMNTQQMSSQF